MNDSYPHAFVQHDPSGTASMECPYCGISDNGEGARDECPVRLRQALNEAQAVIAADDECAGLGPDRIRTCSPSAADAWVARQPHVAAHKARKGKAPC